MLYISDTLLCFKRRSTQRSRSKDNVWTFCKNKGQMSSAICSYSIGPLAGIHSASWKCTCLIRNLAQVTDKSDEVYVNHSKNGGTHSAGLTVVPVVSWEGAPAARGPRPTANFLPCCFDVRTSRKRSQTTSFV